MTGQPMSAAEVGRLARAVLDAVGTVVVGKREALELVLAGILAGGNVLLEDLPGLGKTLTARSFAQALGLNFRRLQFTPDLLPADVTGSFLYDQRQHDFTFRPGPVFTNLLLADEINRTPPKTQAALLEAMQEKQVSVEGVTYRLSHRSTCSPRPTRSSTRAPIRCRRRSWTGSSYECRSATRPRPRSGTCCGAASCANGRTLGSSPSWTRRRCWRCRPRWSTSQWRTRSASIWSS